MCIQVAVKHADRDEVVCDTLAQLSAALEVPVPASPDGKDCLCHLYHPGLPPVILSALAGQAGLFFGIEATGMGLMAPFDELKAREAAPDCEGSLLALPHEEAAGMIAALRRIRARAGDNGRASLPVPVGDGSYAMVTVEFMSLGDLAQMIVGRAVEAVGQADSGADAMDDEHLFSRRLSALH